MMRLVNPGWTLRLFPWIDWRLSGEGRTVCLTFDDGPDAQWTPSVLDILGDAGVSALFFVLGEKAARHPGLLRRMIQEGHEAGNHGLSHQPLWFKSNAMILKEIQKTDLIIKRITGQHPRFFRPPHGRFDPRFQRFMKTTDHRMMLWSLMPYDFSCRYKEIWEQTLIQRIHSQAIITLHDGHINSRQTVRALPRLIKQIQNLGYTFTLPGDTHG